MPIIKGPITGITSPVPGTYTTVKVPIGPRYHWMKYLVQVNGQDPENIDALCGLVRLKMNEGSVREIPVEFLRRLARFNGIEPAKNEIPIYFAEPWQTTPAQMYSGAWDTDRERSFTVEIFINKGVVAAGADISITGVEAHDWAHAYRINGLDNWVGAIQLPKDATLLKRVIHQSTSSQPISAGTYNFTTLPLGEAITRLYLQSSNGTNFSRVEVLADDLSYHDLHLEENANYLADLGMAASAFTYPIVFDEYGTADAIKAARSLNVRIHGATAPAVTVLLETVKGGF